MFDFINVFMEAAMSKYIGEIMLFTTAIIWGSGFVFSAISLDYLTPYQILAVRFSVGVLILSFIFYKRLRNIKKSTLLRGFISITNGWFTIYNTVKKCFHYCY